MQCGNILLNIHIPVSTPQSDVREGLILWDAFLSQTHHSIPDIIEKMGDIDTSEMKVFAGCCCCNTVLYLDFPEFVGCSGVCECLCIREEFCLKADTEPMPCIVGAAEDFLLKIGIPCCSCGLKVPIVLFKIKSQCCCIVGNAALPPDQDSPLMCAIDGFVFFPVQGWCLKMKNVAN